MSRMDDSISIEIIFTHDYRKSCNDENCDSFPSLKI